MYDGHDDGVGTRRCGTARPALPVRAVPVQPWTRNAPRGHSGASALRLRARGAATAQPMASHPGANRALPIHIRRVTKTYGDVHALDHVDLEVRERRIPHPARTFRLRQDHPPDGPGGVHPPRLRQRALRRPGGHSDASAQAGRGHGVPELRAVSAHDGSRKHRIPTEDAGGAEGRHGAACRKRALDGAARRVRRRGASTSSPAVRSSGWRSPGRSSSNRGSC